MRCHASQHKDTRADNRPDSQAGKLHGTQDTIQAIVALQFVDQHLMRFYLEKLIWHIRLCRTGFSLSAIPPERYSRSDRLNSLRENSKSTRLCSARLWASTFGSSTCPPEGRRYMIQNRVLRQSLGPVLLARTSLTRPRPVHWNAKQNNHQAGPRILRLIQNQNQHNNQRRHNVKDGNDGVSPRAIGPLSIWTLAAQNKNSADGEHVKN